GNITLGGSGSNRTIEVLPGLNQTGGPATITVSVNDGTTTTQTTFDVMVTAVNDAPIDVTLSGSVVDENSADGTIIGNVSGTDPDVGDVLMFSLINSAGGRFAVDVNTGEFTVADGNQLDFEAASSHGVTVRVTDSGGLSRDESYTITVSDLNEAPTAVNDTFSARQMEELVVPAGVITGNDFDSDGDSVTVVLVAGPGDGTLALAADGSFTYASAGLFSGQDQFTYYVTDGTLNSDVATVDIDVLMTIVVPDVVRVTDSDTSSEIQEDAVDEKPTDDNEATVELPSDAANATATSVSAAKNITTGEQDSGRPTVPEMSIEVLQSTGSDLSIFVFLSDVPESGFQHNDNRALQNDSSGLIDRTSVDAGRFLFRQIYTDSAFFPSGQMASAMTEYWQHQDDQAVQEQVVENMVVGSTAMVSTSVSVGYAVWLLRGGSLLTTFLSSLPVWQAFDPLHVLNSFEEYGDEEQNSESLESLVS
ncbi:MAG: hypothetical protein GY758_00870, partial [Fuerstiella sp.]|nr:hypothetical protein [Fuerstiella sp.]